MRMLYKHYYIADIFEDSKDFPTFFGHFQLNANLAEIADGRIKEYVDYSIAVWPLIESDRIDEVDFEEEERRFGWLIDPSEWFLENDGLLTPILIPVFCTEQQVNWRLDPSRKAVPR